jgi:transcription elongation factor Elf1
MTLAARDFVGQLKLAPFQTKRFDCPSCGGKYCFSVTHERGQYMWNCFKASCDECGRLTKEMSIADLWEELENKRKYFSEFLVPEHFSSAINNDKTRKYMVDNHCMDAYVNYLADIRYDPRLDRVAFLIRHNGIPVDAVGRSLKGVLPKWYRYSKSGYPFICGNHNTAVVVEDAASACAVSSVITGIALLGTSLQDNFIGTLQQYDKVIVALDKDASIKAIDLSRKLSYYVKTSVLLLEQDLKTYDSDRIKGLFT